MTMYSVRANEGCGMGMFVALELGATIKIYAEEWGMELL
jgi:hypothetical protein